jgi:hypothetical protein
LESVRDIGLWDSSSAEGIGGMFYYSGLKTLVGLDTFLLNAGSNVESQYINTSNTFHYSRLINLSGLPYNIFTDGKIRPYQLFQNCRYLETLDGANLLDLSECTDISYMFVNCKSLTDISACSNWDVANVTGFTSLFGQCDLLTDITPTAGWNLGSATSVKGMFMKSSARGTTTYTLSEIEEWRCSNNQFVEYLSVLTDDVVLDLINSQYYTEPHLRLGRAYVENSPTGKEYRVTSNSMFGGRDIFELVKISNTQYQLTFLNPNATPAWYREKIAYYVTRGLI